MNGKIFMYDGSFYGYMTVLSEIFKKEIVPLNILSQEERTPNLFDNDIFVDADKKKGTFFIDRLTNMIGEAAFDNIVSSFLSKTKHVELKIYEYIKLGMEMKRQLTNFISDARVLEIHRLAQKVRWESNKLTGFVRFKEIATNDVRYLYSAIEPDYFVLPLVAPVFQRRLPESLWIIHDKKHKAAAFGTHGKYTIKKIDSLDEPDDSAHEKKYQEMWKSYFHFMSIDERVNVGLQKQFVPLKYRKNITEFQ